MTTLRQASGPQYSRILGFGGVRGEHVVTNDEVAGPIDSSDEWIRQRTGIVTRRRAGSDVDVVDLSEQAARRALDSAGLTGADIDAVLLSTVTYFHQTPAAAAIVADRIGATPAAAYDISAACAGFSYGVGQADALVRAGISRPGHRRREDERLHRPRRPVDQLPARRRRRRGRRRPLRLPRHRADGLGLGRREGTADHAVPLAARGGGGRSAAHPAPGGCQRVQVGGVADGPRRPRGDQGSRADP